MVFAWLAYALPIRFEENDDVVMLLFSSGKYSGSPEPHLVFINYVYGLFLTLLYSVFPGIEWYTAMLAAIHVLSISVISWTVVNAAQQRIKKILFLSVIYALEVRFILQFQFTTTSALCALAGVLLLREKLDWQKGCGSLLVVVAGLVRFEAAMLVLFVASPLLVKDINLVQRKQLFKPIVFLALALACLGVFKYIDHAAYQESEAWKYYQRYNKARGQINDNPNVDRVKSGQASAISPINYDLLLDFFPDPEALDLLKLTELNSQLAKISIRDKVGNIIPSLKMYLRSLLLILLLSGVILVAPESRTKNRLVLFLTTAAFFFSLCYISLDSSLKYRVFVSALLPLLFVMHVCWQGSLSYWTGKVSVACLAAFIFFSVFKCIEIRSSNLSVRKTAFVEQKKLLDAFFRNNSNKLVAYGANLNLESYPPFAVSENCKNQGLIFSGWVTGNPLNHDHFNSYRDLINKDAVFFDRQTFIKTVPKLGESILKTYRLSVKPVILLESPSYIIATLRTIH